MYTDVKNNLFTDSKDQTTGKWVKAGSRDVTAELKKERMKQSEDREQERDDTVLQVALFQLRLITSRTLAKEFCL